MIYFRQNETQKKFANNSIIVSHPYSDDFIVIDDKAYFFNLDKDNGKPQTFYECKIQNGKMSHRWTLTNMNNIPYFDLNILNLFKKEYYGGNKNGSV